MSRTYFVSYNYNKNEGFGFGMTCVTIPGGIDYFSDVEKIAEHLRSKNNFKVVVIINWKEIDVMEPPKSGGVEGDGKA